MHWVNSQKCLKTRSFQECQGRNVKGPASLTWILVGGVGGSVAGATGYTMLTDNEFQRARQELVVKPHAEARKANGGKLPPGFEYDRYFFGHPGGARP